jgi:ubiquinone/menaquinone biosynthesis C-methylase UbiE
MSNKKVNHYEKTWRQFDRWYDTHQALYQTEIKALEKVMPSGLGLEIGVGTGRFASALSIRYGLDPSFNMLKLAKQRNINVIQGVGENLPFKNESFHFVLIVFTIELVDDPPRFLKEAVRTLKQDGTLILGMTDRNSPWGEFYIKKAAQGESYAGFRFLTPEEILEIFKNIDMEFEEAFQTLFQPPPDIKDIEQPKRGFGRGGFVVLTAAKTKI